MPYDEDVWSDALQNKAKAKTVIKAGQSAATNTHDEAVFQNLIGKIDKGIAAAKPKKLSDKARLAKAIKSQNKLNDVVVGPSQSLEGTK